MTENNEQSGVLVQIASEDARIALYSNVIAPGAPKEQVALIHHYAHALGLDPLRREVMLVSFDRKQDDGNWGKQYSVIVNVHGLIKMMSRQHDFAGMASGVVYPGEPCKILPDQSVEHTADIQARNEMGAQAEGARRILPIGAWCTVRRMLHGEIVRYTTYLPFVQVAGFKNEWFTDDKGKRSQRRVLRDIWGSRPDWMNEKCAIAFSARKGFDHAFGAGVYAAEEIGMESRDDGSIRIPTGAFDGEEKSGAVVLDDEPVQPPTMDEDPDANAELLDSMYGPETAEPWTATAAPPTRDELVDRLLMKAEYARTLFAGDRSFVSQGKDGYYIIDSQVLEKVGRTVTQGPLRLEDATDDQLTEAATLVGAISFDKEQRGGK